MKKLIAFVFIVCSLVIMGGCNNSQPEYEEPNYTEKDILMGNAYSDIEGISVQVSGIYSYLDKTTIVINWKNDSDYSVIYGEPYWIERFENDEWVSCLLKDDVVFKEIAYELRKKELDNKEYIITNKYDVNKSGTYRFLSNCSVYMEDEQSTECSVWVEFIIE